MSEKITTIRIKPETRDRFKFYGYKTETFDSMLNRLLDEVEIARKQIGESKGNGKALCSA